MEFEITCPVDGPVTVSLEDIDTVVIRESERADITFVCPHCGSEITVSAIVPAFLMAAIEALADDPEAATVNGLVVLSGDDYETAEALDAGANDARVDAYCEYFHRQLEHIGDVEDVLAEIDSSGRS